MTIIDKVRNTQEDIFGFLDNILAYLEDTEGRSKAIRRLNRLADSSKLLANYDDLVAFYKNSGQVYSDIASGITSATALDALDREVSKAIVVVSNLGKPPTPDIVDAGPTNLEIRNVAKIVFDATRVEAPKKTGNLVMTAYLEIYEKGFAIVYPASYATRVHEDMTIKHPIHVYNGQKYDCQGNSKFVERVLQQAGVASPLIVFNPGGGLTAFVKVVKLDSGKLTLYTVPSEEELS